MKKDKSFLPSSGRTFARFAEGTARGFCGAILPGMFLGALICGISDGFPGGGFFSIPGVPVVVAALEAIFGAVLVGSWRERHGLRGLLIFPALLLVLLSFAPGPRTMLAATGILLGGYLTALPLRNGWFRALFGAAFALTVFLSGCNPHVTGLQLLILFPLLFASAILWVRAHWVSRLILIVLLPAAAILFAEGTLFVKPAAPVPNPRSAATALPSILMTGADSARVLFLSNRDSLLPETWEAMPFVSMVESIRPKADAVTPGDWTKLRPHIGPAGKIVAGLTGKYQLIYLDTLPRGSEAARRGFVEELWRLLDVRNGVLVLPAINRLLLPASAQWAALPGAGGAFVAASRNAVSTDPELLDQRLQTLLMPYGEENRVPAGIIPALYYTTTPPALPEPENDPCPGAEVIPARFWSTLLCLLAGYAVIRLYFRRFGRNANGFALAENGTAFALILLTAFDAMSRRELFTGIPAVLVWGCIGIAFLSPRLRPRAGRLLIFTAALLPAIWLIPWNLSPVEPGWIAVAAVAALAAGTVRGKIAEESGFPRSWCTTFSAVGWLAGGAIYAILFLLLRDPLLPSLAAALLIRFAWPLET